MWQTEPLFDLPEVEYYTTWCEKDSNFSNWKPSIFSYEIVYTRTPFFNMVIIKKVKNYDERS